MLRYALVVLASGCVMTGTYLDARTPPRGTFKMAYITQGAGGRNAESFPSMDVAAGYSITDDISVHARTRLTSLGGEAAVRWRFLQAGPAHLALAPSLALGMWPASRGVEEDTNYQRLGPGLNALARLSALATFDLGGGDVNLAAFAGVSRLPENAVPAGDDAPYAFFDYEMQGVVTIAGGSFGFGFPGHGGWIRPAIEWTRFITRNVDAGSGDPPFRPDNVWTVTVTFEQ